MEVEVEIWLITAVIKADTELGWVYSLMTALGTSIITLTMPHTITQPSTQFIRAQAPSVLFAAPGHPAETP